jgi:hypothetical protein
MDTKTILKPVPGMMALGVLGKTIPKNSDFGMGKKKKKGKKNRSNRIIPRGFMDVMIGVPAISATSTMINDLP